MATIKERVRALEDSISSGDEVIVEEVFHGFFVRGTRSKIQKFLQSYVDGCMGKALPVCALDALIKEEIADPEFFALADSQPDLFKQAVNREISTSWAKHEAFMEEWKKYATTNSIDNPMVLC